MCTLYEIKMPVNCILIGSSIFFASTEYLEVMSKPSGTASARLRADYMRIKRDPVPYVTAEPLPSNILEW